MTKQEEKNMRRVLALIAFLVWLGMVGVAGVMRGAA